MNRLNLILITVFILFLSGCNNEKNSETKFYGNVDLRTVSLGFRVSGKIDSLNFEEGEKIKKGDLIASLDERLYQEYLNQISAQIKIQKAKIKKLQKGYRKEEIGKAKALMIQRKKAKEKAKKDLYRKRELYKNASISEQSYDDIKAVFDNAEALYQYAKSNLELLENGYEKEDITAAIAQLDYLLAQQKQHQINLGDTKLYSPSNGTLLTRVYEVGSIVNSSLSVVEIAKDDQFWVRSYMSEKYLGLIKQGMEANIYTDSDKSKIYKGVVSFISPLAEFTPKSVQTEDLRTDLVYRFRIVLSSYDDNIRQGMPVTIIFPALKIKE